MKKADSAWRDAAACTATDPELFFPIGTSGPALAQTAKALQICRGCPARHACLEWAIQTGADFGIWGGLTEDERRALQRRRRRTGRAATDSTQKAADRDRSLRALDAAINHVRANSQPTRPMPPTGTSIPPDRAVPNKGGRIPEHPAAGRHWVATTTGTRASRTKPSLIDPPHRQRGQVNPMNVHDPTPFRTSTARTQTDNSRRSPATTSTGATR